MISLVHVFSITYFSLFVSHPMGALYKGILTRHSLIVVSEEQNNENQVLKTKG